MKEMTDMRRTLWGLMALMTSACFGAGCATEDTPPSGCIPSTLFVTESATQNLEHRAYVVSRDSGEITVIDLDALEVMAVVDTCGIEDHMLELNSTFDKGYLDSTGTNETIVLDVRKLEVKKRIPVARHPTHLTLSKDGKFLGIVGEADNAVSFVDTEQDVEVRRMEGFFTPHMVRFAPDGQYAYVANIGAHHITRVDLDTMAIDGDIVLDGFQGSPRPTPAPDEGGFADAQIDSNGLLYAAHAATGRVLVYDTRTRVKTSELPVGSKPWIVYAEHPFPSVQARVVPNFGDQTVSVIDSRDRSVTGDIDGADSESFGVNYSSLVPDRAFVMNRYREEIAVVDTKERRRISTIPVGGNTETAATTADGKWIVATVSSANRVVVIDAETATVVKAFDNVGKYPWSVTIPLGQNYCH
jgi:DNA-binding beta-propeller fold protein YncE